MPLHPALPTLSGSEHGTQKGRAIFLSRGEEIAESSGAGTSSHQGHHSGMH